MLCFVCEQGEISEQICANLGAAGLSIELFV